VSDSVLRKDFFQ